jgi:restriction system protein
MALWIVRAGKHGEYEYINFTQSIVSIDWSRLNDLSAISDKQELVNLIKYAYHEERERTRINWATQVWTFLNKISIGDIIALPLKKRAIIALGEISGGYRFSESNPSGARHIRPVKYWAEFSKGEFAQDILNSFQSQSTVCNVNRNNAEERVRLIYRAGQIPTK